MFLKKWMNIPIGDLYSMYVVLQGIACLPCIRVKCYIRNSRWGVATLDVWSSETRTFQQKNPGPPKWSISFYIVLQKGVFQAHRRVLPTTRVGELWKKSILQWQPMELGGVPQKMDEYFRWGPIFYVCSSARNCVSSMYKGIYHIRNSRWGVATLDVWSSETRTFQQKNP